MQLLLERGASIDARNDEDATPLHIAILTRKETVAKLLERAETKQSRRTPWTVAGKVVLVAGSAALEQMDVVADFLLVGEYLGGGRADDSEENTYYGYTHTYAHEHIHY